MSVDAFLIFIRIYINFHNKIKVKAKCDIFEHPLYSSRPFLNQTNRIWQIQLCFDFNIWHCDDVGDFGFVLYQFCVAGIRMWSKFNSQPKGDFRRDIIFWHHLFIAHVGLFSRHKRTPNYYSTNIGHRVRYVIAVDIYQ